MTKKKYFFTVVTSLIIVILILAGVVYHYVSPNLFEKPAIVKTDSGVNPGGGDVPDSPPSIFAATDLPSE